MMNAMRGILMRWPSAAVLVCGLAAGAAQAALHGRLPSTPGGTDYRAYYDSVLNVTWVAGANLAQASGYDADGQMTFAGTQAWIASLNAAAYLGSTNWRLPGADLNGDLVIVDCAVSPEINCRDNEMGHLFVRDLLSQVAQSPFSGVAASPASYWSGTDYAPDTTSAWTFSFGGSQGVHPKTDLLYAWAVRPGDVDSDGDAIVDSLDDCTLTANPTQIDADIDGYGNACDADLNNSGLTTSTDFNLLRSVLNQPAGSGALAAAADINGSGLVTSTDFSLLRARLNTAPGPSNITPRLLTVATSGSGSGTASSTPAGISCGADCTESYTSNPVVLLSAAPAASSTFAGWSGGCSGGALCVVTMDAARSATANFSLNSYLLTVSIGGDGSGTVTSAPAGISCGADCSETYAANTVVQLTATPSAGSAFSSWGGACAGTGSTSCSVTLDGAKSAVANFMLLDSNPACAGRTDLGSTSGDTGTGSIMTSGVGEKWLRVRLTEDDNSVFTAKYLSARVTLSSPAATDYDLYVYCVSCGGTLAGSSTLGGGQADVVDVRRNDAFGSDQSFDVLIEVRYFSGSVPASWSLSVNGNTTVSGPTCP